MMEYRGCYGMPGIVPAPKSPGDGDCSRICLDGNWEAAHVAGFSVRADQIAGYMQVQVPSSFDRFSQPDFTGKYVYRKWVKLPEGIMGKRLVLQFEGINGFARIFVDREEAAYHKNGFITFDVDITDKIKQEDGFLLWIEVDETCDRVSCFSHGGIIHSVWLYVLPQTYASLFQITTSFDTSYEDAAAVIDFGCNREFEEADGAVFVIFNPDHGMVVKTAATRRELMLHKKEIKVRSPLKWDAEHPWLYTCEMLLYRDGVITETVSKNFGFRELKRSGNQLLVNGKEIKLRGVCRHEISPFHARCLTKELIEQDVRLFKEANCNYVRTSHYPPSGYFLDLCDREGIYVEDELAMAFVAKTSDYTQRDPEETERYASLFFETMARDYSHPSVIIWSLANESFGGYNFDLLNRLIHKMDPGRVTKFSYPMTMQREHEPTDLWSIHYSNILMNLNEKRDNVNVGCLEGLDTPVIHDEYVHVPCYNREEIRRDPGVRNYWGEGILKYWDKMWNTNGALGGAIWAGIDETNGQVGGSTQLEWGIVDVYRRKKPEFYYVRKAYSPIRMEEDGISFCRERGEVVMPVENRFCHTDLSETKVIWTAKSSSGGKIAEGCCNGPKAGSHHRTELILSVPESTECLKLRWLDAFENCVDEYCFFLLQESATKREMKEAPDWEISFRKKPQEWSRKEAPDDICFYTAEQSFLIDRQTGLIREGKWKNRTMITGGPYLHVPYLMLPAWKPETIKVMEEGPYDSVVTTGWYGSEIKVRYQFDFQRDGRLHISYTLQEVSAAMPSARKLRVSKDMGGLDELGLSFVLAPGMDTLEWKRKAPFHTFPEDHIAREKGSACRFSAGSRRDEIPSVLWKDEMENRSLNGKYDVSYKGTNDFRSLKANIRYAVVSNGREKVKVLSDREQSVRVRITEPENRLIRCQNPAIRYHGSWKLMEEPFPVMNYFEMMSETKGDFFEAEFEGTGVVWYASVDVIHGIAKVLIDGELKDAQVNQRVNGVDFPGSADGFDKKYDYPVYSIQGLAPGKHTIRVEVSGAHAEDGEADCISLSYLRVLDGSYPEPLELYVLDDFNYPCISWGNACKEPIVLKEGMKGEVLLSLDCD